MVSKNQLASPRSAFRNFYHPHFSLQKILRPPPTLLPPPPFFVIVLVCCCFILGDPGPVGRVGRKGGTKVFKYGRKSPWVPTLTELFPKIQADAGSWLGSKNALYYCAQSANSFSSVLFVSSYTTAIVSITACVAHAPKKYMQSGNFQFDIWYPGALSPVLQNFRRALSPDPTDCPWVSE